MSNRFHNKFHRENHHSKRTSTNNSIVDASYDPIASYSAPFQGEFCTDGEIVTNSYVQAASATITDSAVIGNDLYVGNNTNVSGDVGVVGSVDITNNLNVGFNATIDNVLRVLNDGYVAGNFTVQGNLSALGNFARLDTLVLITSGTTIENAGPNSTLKLIQTGSGPILHIVDASLGNSVFNNNGYLGLGTLTPNERLTVIGSVSATGSATINNDLTVGGNLIVLGSSSTIETTTIATSSFRITNSGPQTALIVEQLGFQDVVEFKDDGGTSLIVKDGGNVGVNTSTPNEKLTVVGNISATNTVYANMVDLSSVKFTRDIATSTSSVTATDAYIKVIVNEATKYLRLFDVI